MKKRLKKILFCLLAAAVAMPGLSMGFNAISTVYATSINDIKNQINQTNEEINSINSKIDDLMDEQDIVQEKIDDLNAEIINAMTSISMKQDEIDEKQRQISDKQKDIDTAEEEYYAAKAREEKQYDDMVTQIRFMYEQGDISYASLLVNGEGLSDALNRLDYMELVYEYSRTKLEEFEALKNEVHDLWDRLEEEKSQLEIAEKMLEDDKAYLEDLKANLDADLEKKKRESANYDAEIKKAKKDAEDAKKKLQQEQKELKRLQEIEAKKNANASNKGTSSAASGTYTETSYTSIIDNASGSDMGKRVAKYACQYIGNPYVAGGTSLTNGADCSGFTYRVYSDFGYSLPRTSYEQRSAGSGVNYSEAQPGDLICYDGHVALYIGGGKIVHASTAKTGIKVGNANYRPILAVRRIL